MKNKMDELLNKCAVDNIGEIEPLSKQEVKEMMTKFKKTKLANKAKFPIKKTISGIVAVAACLAAFITVPNMYNDTLTSDKPNIESNNPNVETVKSKNHFYLSASAAEIEENGYFSITQSHSSCSIPYSGCCFFIHGENIKNISLHISKGELYKANISDMNLVDEEEKPLKTVSEYCEYIGNEYSDNFDSNICYGFYFSEDVFEQHEIENGESSPKAFHDCYDDLNNAELTISVAYEDMTEETVVYTLKSGKLELDKETMKPNGNFSDGTTPYLYGVYFIPEENR